MAELLPMDAEKQQAYYDQLNDAVGESLAYFYACIRFNKPFDMNALPASGSKNKWTTYCDKLAKKKLDRTPGGGELGFLDGLTDITKIFGEGLENGNFTKAGWQAGHQAAGRRLGRGHGESAIHQRGLQRV